MSEFNLTKALKAVRERRAEMDEQPRPVRGNIDPNSPKERIARARQLEKHVIEQLEFLKTEPDSEVKEMRMKSLFDRMGELAAEQGDFKRAATISVSPERREHYQKILTAIKMPDDKNCDCAADMVVDRVNRTEHRSPAMMTVDTIVDPRGGQLRLELCRKCGFQNARG
jgi:hypothetical protein